MEKRILATIVGGNIWECQVCKKPDLRRIQEVTGMMIHLVQVHGIGLELQSFPAGVLQTGAIFHISNPTETVDEKYTQIFKQPSPYSRG